MGVQIEDEGQFLYWGNEGSDQIELLAEQVANLEEIVEEQGEIIEELSENVMYKEGAGVGRAGRASRMPLRRIPLTPTAMAKRGAKMLAETTLKELGISVPYIGLIVGLTFQIYEGVMKEIARNAVLNAIKNHEREDAEKRKEIIAEALEAVERDRREAYRAVVPP